MSMVNRALARDVLLYDSKNFTVELGGFCVTAGVTNVTLHQMVEIIVTIREMPDVVPSGLRPDDYRIKTESGERCPWSETNKNCGADPT